jgi:hypothetical protein
MNNEQPQQNPRDNEFMSRLDALDSLPVPFKKGDWVESKEGSLQVGIVKDCYWTSGYQDSPDQCLVDLFMYDYDENKIGRASPALEGPRTFEPCLTASDWKRIEKPRFPIEIQTVPSGEVTDDGRQRFTLTYATLAKGLPDRAFVRPRRKGKYKAPVVQVPSPNGFNLEAEILGKRLAAEKLRDTAHKLFRDNPEVKTTMIAEAEKLEREADILAKND